MHKDSGFSPIIAVSLITGLILVALYFTTAYVSRLYSLPETTGTSPNNSQTTADTSNKPPSILDHPSTDYPSYEPPLHPNAQAILDGVDKFNTNIDELDWITFSKSFRNLDMGEFGKFDFSYPTDYFVSSISNKDFGYCVNLRGKEEIMFSFCWSDQVPYINTLANKFGDDAENTNMNGKEAVKINSPNYGIFPKEELLIINKNESGEIESAFHLTYPKQDLTDFEPKDPGTWNVYKEGYIRTDIPVAKRVIDSFSF